MPSDLTAAVEAAKEIVKQSYAVQGLPSELQGGYVNTAIRDGYKVADALLDLTSQPLYRRRRDVAKWENPAPGLWFWKSTSGVYGIRSRDDGKGFQWLFLEQGDSCVASLELAQAACEDHFWNELESSVVERIQ